MPLLAHPRLTAWAADLIQTQVSSLTWYKRLMRSRLLLGTQMTDVEADMYDRGLWFFGVIAAFAIPAGLIGWIALIYATIEGRLNFNDRYKDVIFFATSSTGILVIGLLPLLYTCLPLISRNATQEYKIPPHPYLSWAEQAVRHSIFRGYLQHLVKHKRWNPLYWIFCYFCAVGAQFSAMEGHTHRHNPVFAKYSYLRLITPVVAMGVPFFLLLSYELMSDPIDPSFFGAIFCASLGLLGFSGLHVHLGKAHPQFIGSMNIKPTGGLTRAHAARMAAGTAIGMIIVNNSHHIKAWVLSWW